MTPPLVGYCFYKSPKTHITYQQLAQFYKLWAVILFRLKATTEIVRLNPCSIAITIILLVYFYAISWLTLCFLKPYLVWSWWWHFKIRKAGNIISIRLITDIKGHTVNKNESQGLNLGHLSPHLLLYLTKPHCLVLETLETSIFKAPQDLHSTTNMRITGMCWFLWNAEARQGLKSWCFAWKVQAHSGEDKAEGSDAQHLRG